MAKTFKASDFDGGHSNVNGKKVMHTQAKKEELAADRTTTAALRESEQTAIDQERKIQDRMILDARTKAIAGLEADKEI